MLRRMQNTAPLSKQLRYRYRFQQQRVAASSAMLNSSSWNLCHGIALACVSLFLYITWSTFVSTRVAPPVIAPAEIRIFGPTFHHVTRQTIPESNFQISFQQYDAIEQRDFLNKYGRLCQVWIVDDRNLLLERYDSFQSSYFQTELWKYCMLYLGVGNFYFDWNNLALIYNFWSGLRNRRQIEGVATSIALKLENTEDEGDEMPPLHESLLYLAQQKSSVALNMMRLLVETPMALLESHDMLPGSLAKEVEKEASLPSMKWEFWITSCQELAPCLSRLYGVKSNPLRSQCATTTGFSCQVTMTQPSYETIPILALRNPGRASHSFTSNKLPLPYKKRQRLTLEGEVGVDASDADLPFMSTIRLVDLNELPATASETPNFFDILLQNDCVPTQKECHHCLQKLGSCNACLEECPCYCKVLCRVRPPPKRVVQDFLVRPPMYRKDPSRLIPRIVHQTWFEAVTSTKYPNMSRLIESWRSSGWDYRFYDDAKAAEFLTRHFPPHVREAYDALVPGAFKADLFRYCVLLIHGGVYADMDVLLESNLDRAIAPDVGFMTPIDEPGTDVGHRSCLWNGFLAVAPGHPVMAKVIELVVNHIRNRFTSVDNDDWLCPNPVLSVSHTLDTLFTCGPCILGAALNILMKRHPQTQFEIGTLNVWGIEPSLAILTTEADGAIHYDHNNDDDDVEDDPRWLFPGRTIILHQNKHDMGAHRFTWLEQNMLIASTDLPDYDDRSSSSTTTTTEHYSKAHENVGVYGLQRLYRDRQRVNENIRIRVLEQ